LQTELEAGKNLNDTLEKENTKQSKKIKKLTTQVDKSNIKIETLESSLKSLQEQHMAVEASLKVKIELRRARKKLLTLIRLAV
jgi:TolA-binding protein